MNLEARSTTLAKLGVSRETTEKLDIFIETLRRWQRTINLISKADLGDVWTRHVLDSGQLLRLAPPEAAIWIDIGSGGGFPGIILAIMCSERPGAMIHLVESDQRKAAFLRTVSRETSAPTIVHAERAESVLPKILKADVVVSRATTSLGQLLDWTGALISGGAIGLFPKGENVAVELTDLPALPKMKISLVQSLTCPAASVVKVQCVNSDSKV